LPKGFDKLSPNGVMYCENINRVKLQMEDHDIMGRLERTDTRPACVDQGQGGTVVPVQGSNSDVHTWQAVRTPSTTSRLRNG
jgi:hypothetical protein